MNQERDEASQTRSVSPTGRNGSANPFEKRLPDEPGLFDAAEEAFGSDHDLYEEPDRDTDGSASFYEHSIEEEPDYSSDEPVSGSAQAGSALGSTAAGTDEGLDELDDDLDLEDDDDWDEPDMSNDTDNEAWLDERGYPEDEGDGGNAWPLGLIAVAVVALILLIAGGYGVMQQRSATQEEIRELRAALATAASPEEVAESRSAAAEAEQRNVQLKEQLYTLSAENRRLADTVAGLEAQMAAQEKAIAEAMTKAKPATAAGPAAKPAAKPPAKPAAVAQARPAPKPAPVAKPKPAPVTTPEPAATTAAAAGTWFVNFGSYGSAAVAQEWTQKLKTPAGRVITAPSERDGRTFYRVRVVDLPNKLAAQNVARGLEEQYGLSKLWVGKQP